VPRVWVGLSARSMSEAEAGVAFCIDWTLPRLRKKTHIFAIHGAGQTSRIWEGVSIATHRSVLCRLPFFLEDGAGVSSPRAGELLLCVELHVSPPLDCPSMMLARVDQGHKATASH
jgi:hypothetical protein